MNKQLNARHTAQAIKKLKEKKTYSITLITIRKRTD